MRSIALIILLFTAPLGCTFLLDKNTSQCSTSSDCARFSGTVCNVEAHVCVPMVAANDGGTTTLVDAGDPCLGPAACYACQPTTEEQVAARCTDSTCVPFDNNRLTNRNPDGTLKPLP